MSQFLINNNKVTLNNRQVIDATKTNKDDAIASAIKHRTKWQKFTDLFHFTNHKQNITNAFDAHYNKLSDISDPTQKSVMSILLLRNEALDSNNFDKRLKINLNKNVATIEFHDTDQTVRLGHTFTLDTSNKLFTHIFKKTVTNNNSQNQESYTLNSYVFQKDTKQELKAIIQSINNNEQNLSTDFIKNKCNEFIKKINEIKNNSDVQHVSYKDQDEFDNLCSSNKIDKLNSKNIKKEKLEKLLDTPNKFAFTILHSLHDLESNDVNNLCDFLKKHATTDDKRKMFDVFSQYNLALSANPTLDVAVSQIDINDLNDSGDNAPIICKLMNLLKSTDIPNDVEYDSNQDNNSLRILDSFTVDNKKYSKEMLYLKLNFDDNFNKDKPCYAELDSNNGEPVLYISNNQKNQYDNVTKYLKTIFNNIDYELSLTALSQQLNIDNPTNYTEEIIKHYTLFIKQIRKSIHTDKFKPLDNATSAQIKTLTQHLDDLKTNCSKTVFNEVEISEIKDIIAKIIEIIQQNDSIKNHIKLFNFSDTFNNNFSYFLNHLQ